MTAVVFDFDGVIAQSMEQHAEAYRQVLAPHGITVEPRDVLLREGARSETILADLIAAAGQDPTSFDIASMADDKQRAFAALGTPPSYPGAAGLLEATWQRSVPTAVVTGTRRVNLEALIPDWAPRFDALLTQESYTHDKPHPEPYSKAAEALGVDPAECVAVENAIRGIESARAAGYGSVMAICTTLSAEDLAPAGPDIIAGDHDGLAAALAAALDSL